MRDCLIKTKFLNVPLLNIYKSNLKSPLTFNNFTTSLGRNGADSRLRA